MKKSFEFKIALISLIALCFVFYLGKSYENTLRGIDSNIHAWLSMSVTSAKNGIPNIPALDPNPVGRNESAIFNDHPFLFFWLNGEIMRALGPSGWSARVLTSFFSVGCVLLTVLLGSTLHSTLFGFIAGLFLLFSRDIVLTGASVSLDPALMFFILLSFVFWLKEKWIWVGISTGVGLWFKSPVVLLVFPTAWLISMTQGKLKKDFWKLCFSVSIALGLGSMIWILTGMLGGWHLVSDYWIRQVWGSSVGGRNHVSPPDMRFPIRLLFKGFVPGFPFLFIALGILFLKDGWKKAWSHSFVQVSVTAMGILFFFLTPMRFRLDYYFNPIFPFLCLLSSYSLIDLVQPVEKKFYLIFSACVAVLLSFLLCTPTPLGPEAFVALKRFIPYIQAYGECENEVMLIPGGEPVGSSLDYSLALKFYTGRKIWIEGCETASPSIQKKTPEWIILSKENFQRCLSPQDRALYPFQLLMGQQILLSHLFKSPATDPSQPFDLTPLERELKPVIDCKPQSHPRDLYHRY